MKLKACFVRPDGGDEALGVQIRSPETDLHVNKRVVIELDVSGSPDKVELYKSGRFLTEVTHPYRFEWDVSAEPEASYEITALVFSDAQTVQSDGRVIVVDRTPPSVTTVAPEHLSSNVSANQLVTISYSEPLLPSVVSESSFEFIIDNEKMPAKGTLSQDATTLTLSSLHQLPLKKPIRVSVSGIADLAGNLADSFSWSFSFALFKAPKTFFPSLGIDARPYHSLSEPRVKFDRSGNLFFIRNESTQGVLSKLGMDWQSIAISTNEIADLEFDSSVRPMVVAREKTTTGSNAVVQSWDGTNWVPVGSSIAGNCQQLGLFLNKPVLLIKQNQNVAVYEIVASQWQAIGNSVEVVNPNGDCPSMAVSETSELFVALTRQVGDTTAIAVRRWTGASWADVSTNLHLSASTPVSNPLVVAEADRPVVLWEEGDVAQVAMLVNGTWKVLVPIELKLAAKAGPVQFHEVPLHFPRKRTSMVLRGGRVVVAFIDRSSVLKLVEWNGVSWDELASYADSAINPSVTSSRSGLLALAWQTAPQFETISGPATGSGPPPLIVQQKGATGVYVAAPNR